MNDVAERAVQAETAAFLDMYQAAARRCATSTDTYEGIHVVWSPNDEDPAFSPVLNLAEAEDEDRVLQFFEQLGRGIGAPRIGVNGDPVIDVWISSGAAARRGYTIAEEEYFWARSLDAGIEPVEIPDRVRIEQPRPEDADEFGCALNVGFELPPDHVRGHVFASTIGRAGWRHYLARIGGAPACTSVLTLVDGVAQLFVTTTVPRFRARGLQTYMIRRRLTDGAAAGCDLAITQTVVDSSSPRNMHRQQFQLLYKRAILEKRL